MEWPPRELKKLYEGAGLKVDWEEYSKVVGAYLKEWEKARELRRKSADWAYIESRPEPLKTALKLLVETGDMKLVAMMYSLPLDVLNEERLKAGIPLVLI